MNTITFATKVKNDFDAHQALEQSAAKVAEAYKASAWTKPAPARNRRAARPTLVARLLALFA